MLPSSSPVPPSATPSPFSTLPTELLVHILRLASNPFSHPSLDQPDLPPVNLHSPRFLASLALVHRSWTPVVEDELTRSVYVGPRGCKKSLRVMLERRAKEGKAGVRNLVLEGPGGGKGGAGETVEGETLWRNEKVWKSVRGLRILGGDERAMMVLKSCSNLRLLIVHGSTSQFTLESTASPTIRQLVLVDSARLALLSSLQSSDLPNLRSLVLDLNSRTMAAFVARRVPVANQNFGFGGFGFGGGGGAVGGNGGGGTAAGGGGAGVHVAANGQVTRLPRRGNARQILTSAQLTQQANAAQGGTARTNRIQLNFAPAPAAAAGLPAAPAPAATPAPPPRPAPAVQYTTTTPDALPPMPILSQITSLTLRLHSSPYAHPFLHLLIDSPVPSSLRHLRLQTSGATEPWLALVPLLTILDDLPEPLSTFHIDYALLEPLFYRVSRQRTLAQQQAAIPRSLSRLDAVILSHFLGFAPGTEGAIKGSVVRRVANVGEWGDLESLGKYLRPFAKDGADGGRGMRCELRKMPAGLICEDEEGGVGW